MGEGTRLLETSARVDLEADALIEEARRRQRRRRRWTTAILVVALAGAGLGVAVTSGSRGPVARGPHPATPTAGAVAATAAGMVLNRPEALAVAADGDLLVDDEGTDQILRRTPDGAFGIVAGTGGAGFSGDGGLALTAELDDPGGMAVADDGTIYLADTGNDRVRAIAPSGTITTVAGNGRAGAAGSSASAIHAAVGQPTALAVGADGRVYVVDDAGLQVITPDGALTTVAAAGPGRLTIDGAPTAFFPSAVAVGRTGDLYVADSSPKLLVELSPDGRVLGRWPAYVAQAGLATAPDGSVLVADAGHFAVERVTPHRLIPIVTFERDAVAGLTGTVRPSGIAVLDDGRVDVDTDGVNGGADRPAIAMLTRGRVLLLAAGSTHHAG